MDILSSDRREKAMLGITELLNTLKLFFLILCTLTIQPTCTYIPRKIK